jgi:hypothetical protein
MKTVLKKPAIVATLVLACVTLLFASERDVTLTLDA